MKILLHFATFIIVIAHNKCKRLANNDKELWDEDTTIRWEVYLHEKEIRMKYHNNVTQQT